MTRLKPLRIAGELALLFGALVAVEQLWLGPVRFAALQPHPYWLPVLAMAVAYGSASAIAAGLIATALWLLAPHAGAPFANPFDRSFAMALPPLLWVAAGIAIGEVTELRRRRIARERHKVATLLRQQDALLAECRTLVAVNRDFQMAFVTGEGERGALVRGVLAIEHGDDATAARHLLDLVERATGTRDLSVYLADGASLRLYASGAPDHAPDHLAGLLVDAIAAAALPIAGEHDVGRAFLDGLGRVAAPLRIAPGAPLIGAILFHAAPAGGTGRAALIEMADLAETIALVLVRRDVGANARAPAGVEGGA